MERRRAERTPYEAPVKCWIVDNNHLPVLPEHIPASCINTSPSGMMLSWPRWWKCKECSYLISRMQKKKCSRSACPFERTNYFLIYETQLKIVIDGNEVPRSAKIRWMKEDDDNCLLGIAFT